jgi:hypothetical protein
MTQQDRDRLVALKKRGIAKSQAAQENGPKLSAANDEYTPERRRIVESQLTHGLAVVKATESWMACVHGATFRRPANRGLSQPEELRKPSQEPTPPLPRAFRARNGQ